MDRPEPIVVPGLGAAAEVYRDEYGIAHVRARSTLDAFVAQGYVTAVDRMGQLEADRRRGAGRWAELAGPGAVRLDLLMRRLDLTAVAANTFAGASAQTQQVFEAYAAGVNAWLEHGEMPAELRGRAEGLAAWEPWQCWLVYLFRHVLMGTFLRKMARTAAAAGGVSAADLQRLRGNAGPELAALPVGATWVDSDPGPDPQWLAELGRRLAVPRRPGAVAGTDGSVQPEVDGSNSWAVSGSRTATGRPLLAGDPHRALDVPNVYHQVHLRAEGAGGFDAIGLALPGVPGLPHFGHNEHVAWCITHGMADDQDLYLEELSGSRYRYRGEEWRELEQRTEQVAVRGGDPVQVVVARTDRGPLVALDGDRGVGVALRWVAAVQPDHTPDCLLPMLQAATAAELEDVVRDWVVPANNLLVADSAGDVRFRLRGRLADRPAANGWTVVPGWDPKTWWRGWVPADQMPAATVADVFVTANTRQVPAALPYVGHDFAGRWRQERILQLLARTGDGTDAVRAIHADVVSGAARLFVSRLPAHPVQPAAAEQLRLRLRSWDGELSGAGWEGVALSIMRRELVAAAAQRSGVPEQLRILDFELLPTERGSWLWAAFPSLVQTWGEDWPEAVTAALTRAAAELVVGRWDELHLTRFVHPLGATTPPDVPVPGDGETVRVSAQDGLTERAVHASVARYLFTVGDWDTCGWVVPHGVSGDPASPHFTDQLAAWRDVRLVPMHYDWSVIAGFPAEVLSPAGAALRPPAPPATS